MKAEQQGGYRMNLTGEEMRRVNEIVTSPLFREYYSRLEQLEANRIFCRHQMQHLLDVGRIAWIRCLEEKMELKKDVVYGAAVLHDIGKSLQYEQRIPHEEAGAKLAGMILDQLPEDAAYTEAEKKAIVTAVRGHRKLRSDPEVLERLLYESDKASRMCFACHAEADCNWSTEKKNREIVV